MRRAPYDNGFTCFTERWLSLVEAWLVLILNIFFLKSLLPPIDMVDLSSSIDAPFYNVSVLGFLSKKDLFDLTEAGVVIELGSSGFVF